MIRNRWRGVAAAGVAAAAILTAGLLGTAGEAAAGNKRLSTPCTYTVGDDIARAMGAVFRVTGGLENATMVSYDRKSHTLIAEILGSTDEVDGAKREIEGFVRIVQERVAPYAKKQHGVTLADADVTLIFYNDTGDEPPYEIVRRQGGSFVEPAAESGD